MMTGVEKRNIASERKMLTSVVLQPTLRGMSTCYQPVVVVEADPKSEKDYDCRGTYCGHR